MANAEHTPGFRTFEFDPSRTPRKDDKFVISQQAAIYLAFLDCGYSSDQAIDMADYATAHPTVLWEDIKPSVARTWNVERLALSKAEGR